MGNIEMNNATTPPDTVTVWMNLVFKFWSRKTLAPPIAKNVSSMERNINLSNLQGPIRVYYIFYCKQDR